MDASAGWANLNEPEGVRGMGRGPGVRAASATSILIDFRYAGVRCREKIALAPTPANLKWAARKKAAIEHEIALGTFDYAAHFPQSHKAKELAHNKSSLYTVREILGAWLDRAEPSIQPETFADYSEYVRRTWMPHFGDLPVDQLTLAAVQTWIAGQSVSRKRILNLLTPLRQAVRQAVEDRILDTDPLAGLKIQRPDGITTDIVDPFTPNEVEAVTGKLPDVVGNLVTFWAWTGMREGELLALTWADVDMERGTVHVGKAIRNGRTKAPKTRQGVRTVRLLQPASEALRRQMSHTRLMGKAVFLNPQKRPRAGSRWATPEPGPWTEKALRLVWEAACKEAGVRYRPPRQLRHTFASWTLSAGESPIWVAKMMGHADPSITQRVYARFIADVFPDAGSKTMNAVSKARFGH